MSYSPSSSDSNSDFEFDNPGNPQHELSSADELFANGVILPTQFQKKNIPPGSDPKCTTNDALPLPLPLPPTSPSTVRNTVTSSEEKLQSKPFWGFKRSASVNADIGINKRRSFLFSLPILPRSHSSGSVQYPRRTSKREHKSIRIGKPGCSSSNSTPVYANLFMGKSSSRKNNVHYDGAVHVSPVLNLSPSCISKGAANLLGFNCFLPKGKDKRRKR